MSNFLVQFEFRYSDVNKNKDEIDHISDIITLGIYEDKETAHKEGNKILEEIYVANKIIKKDFLKKNYLKLYGVTIDNDLVLVNFSNCQLFCTVKELKYKNILKKAEEVISAKEKVRKFKLYNEQD